MYDFKFSDINQTIRKLMNDHSLIDLTTIDIIDLLEEGSTAIPEAGLHPQLIELARSMIWQRRK